MILIEGNKAAQNLRHRFRNLSNEEYNKAINRAVNRVTSSAKTELSKEVRKKYNMKASDVNKRIFVNRSNPKTLTGKISLSKKPIPLMYFKPTKTKDGVRVSILKGKRETIKGAFIAEMRSGHVGVFARGKYSGNKFNWRHKRTRAAGGYRKVGSRWQPNVSDLSIDELKSVSLNSAFSNSVVRNVMAKKVSDNLQQRIIHELKYLTNR